MKKLNKLFDHFNVISNLVNNDIELVKLKTQLKLIHSQLTNIIQPIQQDIQNLDTNDLDTISNIEINFNPITRLNKSDLKSLDLTLKEFKILKYYLVSQRK